MLDADLSLSRAFTGLCEALSPIVEGDALASPASLRSGVAIAEIISQEDRGGDVMLQIQAERLQILAILLESGLERDADLAQVKELGIWVKGILENPDFSATSSLRHPELPAIHKPVLRIVLLLLQVVSSTSSLANENLIEACTTYTLDAADVVLDSILRLRGNQVDLEATLVLGQIVGNITEITRTQTTMVWLDRISEHNVIARTLEAVTRTRLIDGYAPPHIPLILDLHLALASTPLSAEKLAISGTLSAYSDNNIALEAEAGRIEVLGAAPNKHTVHGAWCGMLSVLKALLTTLPPGSTSSFIKSDVVPFVRVCTSQIIRGLSWDEDGPLTRPAMLELTTIFDIFFGIATSTGANEDILSDYTSHALALLTSIRHALDHPNNLSTLLIPSTEEEQAGLEKEFTQSGDGDLRLLDYGKTPYFARRVAEIFNLVRVVLGTLVILTRAWSVVQGDEGGEKDILHPDVSTKFAARSMDAYYRNRKLPGQ